MNEVNKRKIIKKKAVKPFYKVHAHTNPLSDKDLDYPIRPDLMDWSKIFPISQSTATTTTTTTQKQPQVVDIGCAWGGLIVSLSQIMPEQLVLGLEIRPQVVGYTEDRISKLRQENPGKYQNVAVLLCNAMKNLPNYFSAASIQKMFFTFPDPNFKKSKFRRRIINSVLLAEYAFVLADNAILYTITDVEDLHNWIRSSCDSHPLFERITDEKTLENDPCVNLIRTQTEEAKKVDRNHGNKWLAIYRRKPRSL